MRFWSPARWTILSIASAVCLFAFQKPFRVYISTEAYDDVPLPPDYQEKTEFVFARLMYPSHPNGILSRRRWGGNSDWRHGGTSWTQDYPRADRHFVLALRRLTRLHVRSVEQPVNLDDGGEFDWPWLYAVQTGHWQLTDSQAKALREYLLRGGFFMCDDFWGQYEWDVFMASMKKVFPDREVVELPDDAAIFHSVYDLDSRYQVASNGSVMRGTSWKCDGCPDHWRGIFDDHGRLMVAMTFQWLSPA